MYSGDRQICMSGFLGALEAMDKVIQVPYYHESHLFEVERGQETVIRFK